MVTVRAYKYDGSLHRSWVAHLVKQEGSLLVFEAEFSDEVQHDLLGTIAQGTLSVEYYWLDRWYNIFRFSHPNGELRNYYCNVNVPPTFANNVLSYVDLDIDILVNTDFSYGVLDREEFEINAQRYDYPTDVREHTRRAVDELTQLIETRQFPFNQ